MKNMVNIEKIANIKDIVEMQGKGDIEQIIQQIYKKAKIAVLSENI